MSLVRGGLRTVSGLIGKVKKQDYKLQTATSTIGIRGTGYSVMANEEGVRAHVTEGAIVMCNDAGCLDVGPSQTGFSRAVNVRPILALAAPVLNTRSIPSLMASVRQESPVYEPSVAIAADPRPAALAPAPTPTPAPTPAPGWTALTNAITDFVICSLDCSSGVGIRNGAVDVASTGLLNQFTDTGKARNLNNTYTITGTAAENYADGPIAWGRWTNVQVADLNGRPVGAYSGLLYVVSSSTVVNPIISGHFNVSGFTVPMITNAGVSTAAGGSVSGSIDMSYTGLSPGTASYHLAVTVPGQTFSLSGNAAQAGTNGSGIIGISSAVSSTGTGCANGCNGALGYGSNTGFQGIVAGSSLNWRIGGQYGFTSTLGTVSGVVIFK
jgi:hypothetical protein